MTADPIKLSCSFPRFRDFFLSLGDPDVGEGLPGKVQVTLDVLAHNGLLVVAGDVVPLDAISVEVVQHGQAGLLTLTVIGLFATGTEKEKI